MNWWLAYNVALGVGLVIVGAWAYDARRLMKKAARLIGLHDEPTQEIPMTPYSKIGPMDFEWWPPERR